MIDNTSDVNAAYDNFETNFLEVIDNHIPMKKKESHQQTSPFYESNTKEGDIQENNGIYKHLRDLLKLSLRKFLTLIFTIFCQFFAKDMDVKPLF